mmetsp:Transcript_36324/g.26946  ORF Transcript_36324/g.26946 Transcript_36324/m.26946 type:complete len:99 (+) Transcript_36324:840-1136(+)
MLRSQSEMDSNYLTSTIPLNRFANSNNKNASTHRRAETPMDITPDRSPIRSPEARTPQKSQAYSSQLSNLSNLETEMIKLSGQAKVADESYKIKINSS